MPRGFAAMSPEKQKEIASKGGKAAHAQGKAHKFTSEEARVAGKRGGEVVSRDRIHMASIGSLGGLARQMGSTKAIRAEAEEHMSVTELNVKAADVFKNTKRGEANVAAKR
jgi:general stress protein YciG